MTRLSVADALDVGTKRALACDNRDMINHGEIRRLIRRRE